jgi:PAT family beta-lactamase induction signal transducer AmpG
MAVLMLVGFLATMSAPEPTRAVAPATGQTAAVPVVRRTPAFFDAIVGPFTVFSQTHGWTALVMLAMISLYKLPDFVMGPMAAPLYKDLGFSKDVVGSMRASIGLATVLLGVAAGGFFSQRFGYMKALIAGAVLQGLGVAAFAILARSGGDVRTFAMVISVENFGTSFAGVALITYMSSLTSLGYTATQYALLSSTYAYLGKILKGFSGAFVDHLAHTRALFDAYAIFFLCAGAIGIPALILCFVLMRLQSRRHTMPVA